MTRPTSVVLLATSPRVCGSPMVVKSRVTASLARVQVRPRQLARVAADHRAALDPESVAAEGAGVLHREEGQRHHGAAGPGPRRVHLVLGRARRPAVVGHDHERARRVGVTAEGCRLTLGEDLDRHLAGAVRAGHVVLPVGRAVGGGVELVGLAGVGERHHLGLSRVGVGGGDTAEAGRPVAVARALRVGGTALVDPHRPLGVDVEGVAGVGQPAVRAGPEALPGDAARSG